MITKEQAMGLQHGQEIHYGECKRAVGPRGGVKEAVLRCRVSGKCQTWKTRPNEFRLPVKHGLYESAAIDEHNASRFHLPGDCPLNRWWHNCPEHGKQEHPSASCHECAMLQPPPEPEHATQ